MNVKQELEHLRYAELHINYHLEEKERIEAMRGYQNNKRTIQYLEEIDNQIQEIENSKKYLQEKIELIDNHKYQLILKQRFWSNYKIADIAYYFQVDKRQIHRYLRRAYKELEKVLQQGS